MFPPSPRNSMHRSSIIVAASIVALSASGCSERDAKSRAIIANFQKREKAVIEQCHKIATDRDILMAKLDAMKVVFDPKMKPEPRPDWSHECSVPEIGQNGK